MKKIAMVMALAALVAFSSPLFAGDGKMMFGIKGGLNLANLAGDELKLSISATQLLIYEERSMTSGAVGGVFLCYKLGEIFAIQPELLFSMKGAKSKDGDIERNLKLNYFEIPLLFKVNLPTEGKIKPNLYAGPALGILMSAKSDDDDVKGSMKGTDIGIIAGAGLGYKTEGGMFCVEFRYEVGMTTIWELADTELEASSITEQPDIKNSVMSIMVGYGFAF